MKIIEGRVIADQILSKLAKQLSELETKPVLAHVLCTNDQPAHTYAKLKAQAAQRVGVEVRTIDLPETTSKQELIEKLSELSQDSSVDGLLLQLPLYTHLQPDAWDIMQAIDPSKDVDGLTALNQGRLSQNLPAIMPATVAAILECLLDCAPTATLGDWVSGKNVLIINHSSLVGKPLATALSNMNATVTVANAYTGDLKQFTQIADIVITATGKTQLLTAEMFKQDAVVIDVTSVRQQDRTLGDVVESPELETKLQALTPVPGGVGPVTIACLLQNLYQINERKQH